MASVADYLNTQPPDVYQFVLKAIEPIWLDSSQTANVSEFHQAEVSRTIFRVGSFLSDRGRDDGHALAGKRKRWPAGDGLLIDRLRSCTRTANPVTRAERREGTDLEAARRPQGRPAIRSRAAFDLWSGDYAVLARKIAIGMTSNNAGRSRSAPG